MGVPAEGVRLQRDDLLAPAARLGAGRRLAPPAQGAAGAPGSGGEDRLEPGEPGQRERPGQRGGGAEEDVGPNPTDRGKPGSKRHLVVDRQGIPLAVLLTAANLHDSVVLEEALDAVPPVRQPRGRPRRRPRKLHADKAYDYPRCRRACRRRGIVPRIARRGSERLGRHRWVVERTLSWIARCRRLVVRYERRDDIHLAFLVLACAAICFRFLQRFC